MMKILAFTLLFIGIMLLLLVPVHVIGFGGFSMFGIPEDIFAYLFSTIVVLLGIVVLYYSVFRRHSTLLDEKLAAGFSGDGGDLEKADKKGEDKGE